MKITKRIKAWDKDNIDAVRNLINALQAIKELEEVDWCSDRKDMTLAALVTMRNEYMDDLNEENGFEK